MQILGMVPARGGSKGIPGKNIRQLAGRPLIAYTLEAARKSKLLTRKLLTTDSDEIAAIGRQLGIEVPFMRPAELAADRSAAVDYIDHCLRFLAAEHDYRPELVVLLQPTCPLRTSADIDACVELLLATDADSVVSVTALPTKYHPDWQFSVSAEGLLAPLTGLDFADLASARQGLNPTYTRNGAVYAFRRESFERVNNIYGDKVHAYIMPEERSVNIDDMDDWAKAEAILNPSVKRK